MIMKPLAPLFVLALSALATGCSPAADPVAKGSAHYSIQYPEASLGTCGLTAVAGISGQEGDRNVPELPIGTSPVQEFGVEVTDGQRLDSARGNYVVKCRVTGGEDHIVEVLMEGPNSSPLAADAQGTTKIEIRGHIGSNGLGEADITYQTTKTRAGANKSNVPCTLKAVDHEEFAGAFQIDAGEARFTFECKQTELAFQEFSVCEVTGTISVRDCLYE